MGNRQRILDSALSLFNKNGVDKVSVRDISTRLNISPGNFSYHFPDKNQLVADLYTAMNQSIYKAVETMAHEPPSVHQWLETHRLIFDIQIKYKFIYLNLFSILTNHTAVRNAYRENYKLEKSYALAAIDLFQKQGLLIDEMSTAQKESLVAVGQVMNTSWMVDAEVQYNGNYKGQRKYYMRLCCDRLLPFLTPSALSDYQSYFDNL